MSVKQLSLACIVMFLAFVSCGDDSDDTNNGTGPVVNQIPPEGLVAKYSFDGDANDETSFENHGTVYGATLVAGRDGTAASAYSLDGVNDSIAFPEMTYSSGNEVTVSLWAKFPAESTLRYFVVCNDFGVWQSGSDLGIAISTPTTSSAAGAASIDNWVHFAGTYDGDSIKAYIDGVLTEAQSWPGTIAALGRPLTIGVFGSSFWHGSVDDIRIYNRTLPQAGIDSLYNE